MGAQKEWLVQGQITAKVHCTVKAQTAAAARRKALASTNPAVDVPSPDVAWWFEDDNAQALRETIRVTAVSPSE